MTAAFFYMTAAAVTLAIAALAESAYNLFVW